MKAWHRDQPMSLREYGFIFHPPDNMPDDLARIAASQLWGYHALAMGGTSIPEGETPVVARYDTIPGMNIFITDDGEEVTGPSRAYRASGFINVEEDK